MELKLELTVRKSSPLFMEWFDCLIDRLVGSRELEYPSPRSCDALPWGIEFLTQPNQSLLLGMPPCSYTEYRRGRPNYMSGDADFSQQFPLELELMRFYETTSDKETSPEPKKIILEYLPRQMFITIDCDLRDSDPLLWLLRALTHEFPETRDHLIHNYRDALVDLVSRASEPERAAWNDLGWFVQLLIATSAPLDDESAMMTAAPQPPKWFPKQEKTQEKWRASYAVIQDMRKEYRKQYEDGNTDDPNPHLDDLRDALVEAKIYGKIPSASTIERIKKAGDDGYL